MDEWMHLTGGEATHRQHEQRALRQVVRTPERDGTARQVRVALAAILTALAVRLDPTPSKPIVPAQPLTSTPA